MYVLNCEGVKVQSSGSVRVSNIDDATFKTNDYKRHTITRHNVDRTAIYSVRLWPTQ